MKSFKQKCIEEGILDNVLNMGSKFLYFWRNHWILNAAHGLERIIQRMKLSIDQLKLLFKTAIEKFDKMSTEVGQEILFYSKSLNQGFVSVVDNGGNLKLITFLPPGRSNPKPGTEKIVVESLEGEEMTFENILIVEID